MGLKLKWALLYALGLGFGAYIAVVILCSSQSNWQTLASGGSFLAAIGGWAYGWSRASKLEREKQQEDAQKRAKQEFRKEVTKQAIFFDIWRRL